MNDLEKTPAIGMSVQCKLNDKRQVVFQTFVAADAPASTINEMLSKLHDAADTQEARYMIHDYEIHLEQATKQRERILKDKASFVASAEMAWQRGGRKGSFVLDAKQQAHLDQLDKALETTADDVTKITNNLVEFRKKAAA